VVAYADVTRLSPEVAAVYVDMSGDAALAFDDPWALAGPARLQLLGRRHPLGRPGRRQGAARAASRCSSSRHRQAKKRLADWGPVAFQERLAAAWTAFLARARESRPALAAGGRRTRPEAVESTYSALLDGKVPRQRRPDLAGLMPGGRIAAQPRPSPESILRAEIVANGEMTSPSPAPGHATRRRAARTLAAWTRWFAAADIPVLAETAEATRALRPNEDNVDANSLGEMISGDPLMTLKVLAYESRHRGRRVITSAETVISALVMMGISPFFRAFGPQQTIDERLGERPEALAGLQRVLLRAHRGANFALAFAIHRTDPDAAVIHAAALLHEFAEMLLWCHARSWPAGSRRCRTPTRRCVERGSAGGRSTSSSRSCNVPWRKEWRLPALIVESTAEAKSAGQTSARIVSLAARLARHTARGWDNAALPDDLSEISALLNLSADGDAEAAAGDLAPEASALLQEPIT
jgi:HD-like signal output (HDOD) protein